YFGCRIAPWHEGLPHSKFLPFVNGSIFVLEFPFPIVIIRNRHIEIATPLEQNNTGWHFIFILNIQILQESYSNFTEKEKCIMFALTGTALAKSAGYDVGQSGKLNLSFADILLAITMLVFMPL
ncbi:hypothetical protein ACJX0J_017603, partial [Zea mays]